MTRIVNPFQAAHTTKNAAQVVRVRTPPQWTPADRSVLMLSVCMAIAVACGTLVGTVVMSMSDVRSGAAAGGTTFGAVLGSLLVWRAMR